MASIDSNRKCCRPFSGGVLLVLVWSTLFYAAQNNFYICLKTYLSGDYNYQVALDYFYYSIWVLAPITGWVADACLGRYTAIISGLILSEFACFLNWIAYILLQFNWTPLPLVITILCIAILIGAVGFGSLYANLLPFTLDQMIGATAEELSAAVHWHYWTFFPGLSFVGFLQCVPLFFNDTVQSLVFLAIGTMCLSAGIISDCLFHKYLDTYLKIINPIKLIFQVLNYARKTKYPRRRSAFTYIDEEQPSRLDFGKSKFGGPFTEEEVEDVKTVLRLLPLLVGLVVVHLAYSTKGIFTIHIIEINKLSKACIVNMHHLVYYVTGLVLIPTYRIILYPLFHRYIPSMLKRIGTGLFLCFMSTVMTLTLDTVGHLHNNTTHCMFETSSTHTLPIPLYWLLITYITHGLGIAIGFCSFYEFIVAQSPNRMRGFMVGFFIFTVGISNLTTMLLELPFHHIPSAIPSCGFYYYLLLSLLTMMTLVLFVVLAKRYKFRVRGIHVNIQAIAEEYYERYFDQEEEYFRALKL